MNSIRKTSVLGSVVAAAMLVGLAFACPRPSRAQTASVPSTLAGAWVQDGDAARAMHTVEAAFAATVATLPEMFQGFARDRIRGDMEPPRRIVVSLDGAQIRVALDTARTTVVTGPLGASATTSGVADGTRVTSRLEGGWLELRYEGEGSELRQLFSTEPDGARMHLDYHVTGPRIPSPVRYRLDFVRTGS